MYVYARRRAIALAVVLALPAGATAQEGARDSAAAVRPSFHAADARLHGLIDRALTRYPALDELRLRAEAAGFEAIQAAALPDPMLGFNQAIRTPETRVGPQLNTLSVSQSFPWPGVRARRADVARAGADIATARIRLTERDVVQQVKAAYYEVMYADAALGITEQERLLLDQYERLAQTRYAAGEGTQQAVVKLQAEITRILARRQMLDQQRSAAAARLNALLDDPPEAPVAPVRLVPVPDVALDREALVALGSASRPELGLLRTTSAERSERLELARTRSKPTFTLGLNYAFVLGRRDAAGRASPPDDNGKDPISVAFSMSLPVWRRSYDAAIEQAALNIAAEDRRIAAERNHLSREIEDRISRFTMLAEQVDLFERVLLPQAEESLRAAEASYATGQASVLDLLDSERLMLEVRLVLARHQADQLIVLADIERAVGAAFPHTTSDEESRP